MQRLHGRALEALLLCVAHVDGIQHGLFLGGKACWEWNRVRCLRILYESKPTKSMNQLEIKIFEHTTRQLTATWEP